MDFILAEITCLKKCSSYYSKDSKCNFFIEKNTPINIVETYFNKN